MKEDKAATNPQKPYRTGISTPNHQKATATKLVTARLLRASLTDTLNVDGENEIVVEVKAATFDKAADFDIWKNSGNRVEIVPWNIIRDSHTSNGDFIVMGLWNSVRLELVPKMHLSRPYLYTESIEHDRAVLRFEVEIADGQVPELSPYGGTCERRTDHCRAFDTGLSGCVQERTVQICVSLWDENGVVYQESEDVPLCDFEGPRMDPHYYELQFYRRKMTARISQIVDMRHITLSELCEASQVQVYEFYQTMIQAMRENYPRCGGVMPWVFKRPWTTTAIRTVDGNDLPTYTYYAVQNSYRPINVCRCQQWSIPAPRELAACR